MIPSLCPTQSSSILHNFSCFLTGAVQIAVFCVLIPCRVVGCRLTLMFQSNMLPSAAWLKELGPIKHMAQWGCTYFKWENSETSTPRAFASTFPFHSSCWPVSGYVRSPFSMVWLFTFQASSPYDLNMSPPWSHQHQTEPCFFNPEDGGSMFL
jgi:hypothetical protein